MIPTNVRLRKAAWWIATLWPIMGVFFGFAVALVSVIIIFPAWTYYYRRSGISDRLLHRLALEPRDFRYWY